MQQTLLAALAMLINAACASAGVGTITGETWLPSSGGNFCVIVGRIQKITVGNIADAQPDLLELQPLATIAGSFDPSLHAKLTVRCYTGPPASTYRVPPENALVLAAVRFRNPDDPSDFDMIVSDFCTFMPKGSALVEIKGLHDPLYLETLARIQKARAIAIARASTQPTTQPTPRE